MVKCSRTGRMAEHLQNEGMVESIPYYSCVVDLSTKEITIIRNSRPVLSLSLTETKMAFPFPQNLEAVFLPSLLNS